MILDEQVSAGPVSITPTIRVAVRQGSGGSWWVAGAKSDVITVDEPAAGASIGSVFDIAFTNTVMSEPVVLGVYVAGSGDPTYETVQSGSGVFAVGDFSATVDMTSCEDVPGAARGERDLVFVKTRFCDGPAPTGAPGTVVVAHDFGATTVPVVFTGA